MPTHDNAYKNLFTHPQEILDRLQQASLSQLDCWADRILDAQSLDEVFRDR